LNFKFGHAAFNSIEGKLLWAKAAENEDAASANKQKARDKMRIDFMGGDYILKVCRLAIFYGEIAVKVFRR
jgi:hypothetical protein